MYPAGPMRRAVYSLAVSVCLLALAAPAALAQNGQDGGEGLWGETDDKVITNAAFILIAAFPLLVGLLSALQWKLDKRKAARKSAEKARRTRAEWAGGW